MSLQGLMVVLGHYAGDQKSDHYPSAAYCLIMPVIEAQCASILVPHDHRHINHVTPEMTLRYATLASPALRSAYDQAIGK